MGCEGEDFLHHRQDASAIIFFRSSVAFEARASVFSRERIPSTVIRGFIYATV